MTLILAIAVAIIIAELVRKDRSKATNNTAKEKGIAGEKVVSDYLSTRKHGLVINDIIIKNGDNYTQIDHVYITDKAIIVIETKNHSGKIYGDTSSKNWSAVYGDKKYQMYNPLMQNNGHIKALRRSLGDDAVTMVPITVFTHPKCELDDGIKSVYNLYNFKDKIKSIESMGGRLDKKKYYKAIKRLDLSRSPYHRAKQERYVKSIKRKNS